MTGHNGSSEVTRGAERHDGRIYRVDTGTGARVRDRRLVRLLRAPPRARTTTPRRSSAPTGLIGLQRKVHASLDEFFRFRQAYEWPVFDLGFCTVGTAICHDSDFFESWRILALKGAEVVLLPHANRTLEAADGVPRFDGREREAAPDELRRAQEALLADAPVPPRLHDVLARDNGVYAVFSDQVGLRRSQHPRRRRLRARAGRRDARAVGARRRERLGRRRARPRRCSSASARDPAFPLRKRRPETYDELTTRS